MQEQAMFCCMHMVVVWGSVCEEEGKNHFYGEFSYIIPSII